LISFTFQNQGAAVHHAQSDQRTVYAVLTWEHGRMAD
jgi:hypothetical protein